MIICACNRASKDCDKVCTKGRLLEPQEVYTVPWPRIVSRDMETLMRLRDLEDMERDS